MTENKEQQTEEVLETINDIEQELVEQVQVEKEDKEEPVNDTSNLIAELEQKLREAEDKHLRLYAEFDNYRRRVRQDMEAAEKYRAQNLITALLPVIDNFERAMNTEVTNEESKSLLQGMEMIYNQIISALNEEGVEIIEAVGKQFDPNFHQGVMQANEEGVESNTIVEEFQKGYLLKDRVIRPSMVKVNQ